jgi:23S rRNA pseudouridine1911/1915/1917 synthase
VDFRDFDMPRSLPPPTAAGPLLPWLLAALAPTNRTRVKQLLQHGRVAVNGTPATRHDHPLKPGDRVEILREGGPPPNAGLPVVYQDESVVVIDKPAGLLTVATETEKLDTAFVRLGGQLKARVFVVHRLDRDTSGLLLFARSEAARDRLQANWESLTKTYLAVVEGTPQPPDGVVENYLTEGRDLRVRAGRTAGPHAKRAESRYRTVGTKHGVSLVEVELVTGRKHQIRVHLAGLGCPVVGDEAYGAKTNPARRLGLHAWRLALPHPTAGERLELEAPLPAELRRFGLL